MPPKFAPKIRKKRVNISSSKLGVEKFWKEGNQYNVALKEIFDVAFTKKEL